MPAPNELLQEGRYRISQPSNGNSNSKVFEAYDTVRNTNVIVREIPVKLNKVTTVSQRESLQLAFANQAKALTEIEHASLLSVHDYFSEIDRQYLVMEAVEGESLGALVARNNRGFSVAEVTEWADEILDALNYLHSRKPPIIHRNINPENVNLDASGRIKLSGVGVDGGVESDFSGTTPLDDNLRYSPMEQIWPGLDAASQKAITNHYDDRSERILKQPLDERSDIYSLGATLYYLITGIEPVDPLERSIDILEGRLDPLREPASVNPEIPAEISDVLMKSLEIKRENRYDAAIIMRQVLKTALTRVKEREEDEGRVQPKAPAIVTNISTPPSDPAAELAEQQRREAEVERQREEELKALQLREAEEKRIKAERAAEAERQAKADAERQAEAERHAEAERRAEAERLAEAERRAEAERLAEEQRLAEAELERLTREEAEKAAMLAQSLEISHSPEVVAYDDKNTDDEALAAVLSELEELEGGGSHSVDDSDDITVIDSPVDLAPEASDSYSSAADDDEDIFSMPPERSGSSLPMPAIAGAVGLVLVIAVGGWFAMSGGKSPQQPPATVQVAEPAPVEQAPTTDTIVSSQTEVDAASTSSQIPADEQAATATRTAAVAKPKKAEPAKTEKKKVTVDDLINDN